MSSKQREKKMKQEGSLPKEPISAHVPAEDSGPES